MLLEAFLPVFVFVGSFTIIKGIKYSCQKIQYLYINRQFKKAIYKNITKKPYNNNCVICMDDYTENKKRVELFCNHNFHKSCMDDWIKERPTCPLCNIILKTKNSNI